MVCLGWLNNGSSSASLLVQASRLSTRMLLYENMAYRWWISWTSFASLLQCNSRRERRPLTTTPRFPSSVLSSRLANGSRDTNLAFTLFSSSTSESDGQLSSPQPVLRCGILCSPVFSLCSFPGISSPVSLLRYGTVGTVAGDGAPRSLSVVRSSGVSWTRPFSFSDSSLVGSRPFSLPLFHPARALVVLVALGCHGRYWLGFHLP